MRANVACIHLMLAGSGNGMLCRCARYASKASMTERTGSDPGIRRRQAPADTNARHSLPAAAPAPATSAGKRARPAWASATPARASGAHWGSTLSGSGSGSWSLGVAGGSGGGPRPAAAPPSRADVAAHLAACGGASGRGLARHFGCAAASPQGCARPARPRPALPSPAGGRRMRSCSARACPLHATAPARVSLAPTALSNGAPHAEAYA